MTTLAMQDGALLFCDRSLSSECCEPGGPQLCPPDCLTCPATILVTITNVVVRRSQFSVHKLNHVEVILHRPTEFCGWHLLNKNDVLQNDVVILNLPDCDFLASVDPGYEAISLVCDPLLDQWMFRITPTGGAFPPPACFVSPAVSPCPLGQAFVPCVPDGPCNFTFCDPQDWCGPPAGTIDVGSP